jgi:hypothetical protein
MNRNVQNRKVNDFPELQIGYPERNDVCNPNWEMERIHVDLENMELKATNSSGIVTRKVNEEEYLREK